MLSRADALKAVSGEKFDVVVIGGGITGAGVALDAASRGYSVALVERDDYAVGTSSRSSKMVHGGLRYLRNFDLGLVREALIERQLLVHLAPHLVYPTPFLVPSLGEERKSRALGIGLNMYDVMSTTRVGRGRRDRNERQERGERAEGTGEVEYWAPDRHRTIDSDEVIDLIPALATRKPSSAYLFYDCQTDDVRLVLTVLGEAERFGAVMVNGAEVTEVLTENGKAAGVRCKESESGSTFEVQATHVVNATGVFADRVKGEEIQREEDVPRISPSRGTHVTVSQEDLAIGKAACVIPAGEERTVFALPWYGRTLIGTTDNDYDGDVYHPNPAPEDIEYLLNATNKFFDLSLGLDDLTGAYAGVRPLISSSDPKKSVDISRRAELYETSSGMLTITGGKLTTWRRMAEQVVDRMVETEGRRAPCRTTEIPLGMTARPEDFGQGEDLDEEVLDQLAFRYGHAARNVLAAAAENPDLAKPIVKGRPDLLAEVVIAARAEQARSVADVLLRRTRLGLLAAPELRTSKSVKRVAEVLGGELGWDGRRVEAEADAWVEAARTEGIDPALALS